VTFIGIDDTDTYDTPGTNQLARALVRRIQPYARCVMILRHQLLFDRRIPYTSKNGSASIQVERAADVPISRLIDDCRAEMRAWFKEGSDPGLCVVERVPEAILAYGRRCQGEIVPQEEARSLAREHAIHLEGLGGTQGGVIGALAAVGLASGGDDGRVVNLGEWPDDLSGPQPVASVQARGIEIRELSTGSPVTDCIVDVGKHLRPNRRAGRVVLFVESTSGVPPWRAVRLT